MAETRTRRTRQEAFPQRGDIYLTALDPALGHEIKKTRPALVIQNDVSNRYGMTTIVAAITSKVSTPPYPNEVIVHPNGTGLGVISTVRLDQIRTVDRRRLIERLGKVDAEVLRKVDEAIKISMGLVDI
ncbi:MAG: type II toxin-antitoxin system PemK/MazF family toxin [Candidatus Solibacter usitatus]|nr:type II toxin-antitoxin system PemK/MazF family toxin [Candidatus Solibacter usitatus]